MGFKFSHFVKNQISEIYEEISVSKFDFVNFYEIIQILVIHMTWQLPRVAAQDLHLNFND